jgi:uncharacterized membrane protein YphA (DoxX/SURF4 family)
MNGSVSRRVFVGSLAGASVGAGAAAFSFADISGQSSSLGPIGEEIDRQLKEALAKMQNGEGAGARQAATVLRVYASAVNDGQLRATLKKANRETLLSTETSHRELTRRAQKLGVNLSRLPPHAGIDRLGREAAFARLTTEGLAPFMGEVADYVDSIAVKMEALERRKGERQALAVALRQPIPTETDCGNCNQEAEQVKDAAHVMEVACALALLFPPLAPACEAAAAAYLVVAAAGALCQLYVSLCRAYYGQ